MERCYPTMYGSRLESKWERVEHALHLRDMCFKAFKSEDLCDLTLTSLPTNQSFLTHKVVIAAFSELWRRHVSGTDVLKIEASPEEVKTLLKYMYTGFIDVSDSSSWEKFQRLANQYQIYLSPKVQKKLSRLYRTEKTCPWLCATCGRNWSRLDHAVAHANNAGHHTVKCSKCLRAVPLLESATPSMASHQCDRDLDDQRLQPKSGEEDLNDVDEENGEDEDWGSPTATMIMPELILQEEEDPEEVGEEEDEGEDEDDDDDGVEDGVDENEEENREGGTEDRAEHDTREERQDRKEPKLKPPIQFQSMKSKLNHKRAGFPHPPSSRKEQEQIRNKKKYLCSLCGSTLTGKTAYNRHQLIHTGKRPFSCEICGKSFTQNMRLTVHSRSHTGERPFLCSLCGKTFVESCKLNRHLQRVHMANKDGNPLIPGQPVINTEKFIMPTHLKRQPNAITGHKRGQRSSVIK